MCGELVWIMKKQSYGDGLIMACFVRNHLVGSGSSLPELPPAPVTPNDVCAYPCTYANACTQKWRTERHSSNVNKTPCPPLSSICHLSRQFEVLRFCLFLKSSPNVTVALWRCGKCSGAPSTTAGDQVAIQLQTKSVLICHPGRIILLVRCMLQHLSCRISGYYCHRAGVRICLATPLPRSCSQILQPNIALFIGILTGMSFQATPARSSRITKSKKSSVAAALGLRRSVSSPSAASPRRKSSQVEKPATFDEDEQLDDTGVIASLAADLNFRDVPQYMEYIRNRMFSAIPERNSGMNSTRIAETLNYRKALPPIVTLAHIEALCTSSTKTEREIAELAKAGILRRVTIPNRGMGVASVGDGITSMQEWERLVRSHTGLSPDLRSKLIIKSAIHMC